LFPPLLFQVLQGRRDGFCRGGFGDDRFLVGVDVETVFSYDAKNGTYYYMRVCTVDGASDVTPLRCSSNKVLTE
jgi:hypothetical protein